MIYLSNRISTVFSLSFLLLLHFYHFLLFVGKFAHVIEMW